MLRDHDNEQLHPVTRLFAEVRAGGFTRVDGTIAFYVRVNTLLDQLGKNATVLDFGAGRGAAHIEDTVQFRRSLRNLRGKAAYVFGVDVDDAVLANPSLDKAYVISREGRLPIDSDSIDLVISDFTFEHIDEPRWMSSELNRVLRSGGWLAARTPNRWGYIAVGNRLVPTKIKDRVVRYLQPSRASKDVFPSVYRCNTPGRVRHWFPSDHYTAIIYAADSEPAYFGNSMFAARAQRLVTQLTPGPFRSILYIFLRKR